MRQVRHTKGFTLVELIIVIAVVAILAVSAMLAYQGVQANARRTALNTDANALASALNNFNAHSLTRIRNETGDVVDFSASTDHLELLKTIIEDSGVENSDEWFCEYGYFVIPVVPPRGVMGYQSFPVHFDSMDHLERALSVLDFTYPQGHFRVNSDRVREAFDRGGSTS